MKIVVIGVLVSSDQNLSTSFVSTGTKQFLHRPIRVSTPLPARDLPMC